MSEHDKEYVSQGFTLLELSIVLTIIGLITGGVLVGRDLIVSARVRSTISQIEKYNSAVSTFYIKYRALPGDMPPAIAAKYGFSSRAGTTCNGDGDGVLTGWDGSDGCVGNGEPGEKLFSGQI